MKKHFILLFAFITTLCSACQEYSYKETELHGIWQVQSVENKTTGEFVEVEGERYFLFQRHMASVGYLRPNTSSDGSMIRYSCEFNITNDSISMGKFYSATPEFLERFGIYDEPSTFAIDHEKRNRLIFTSDKACITMRRY